MFVDVNENDAGAAVRAWAQMLGKDRGIPVDPVVRILKGRDEIAGALQAKAIDAVTLTTEEYYDLKQRIGFGSLIFGVKDGELTEQYLLLVNAGSGIGNLDELKERKLNVFLNPRASLAIPWLDTVLQERCNKRASTHFAEVKLSTKLTGALLPVFFGKADACLVTRGGFETAVQLNPQLGKQLRVLLGSSGLVPSVFCFREDYHSPLRDKLLYEIERVNTTAAGQQFMTLFHCDTLVSGPEERLTGSMELLAHWQALHDRARITGAPEALQVGPVHNH